MPTTKQKRPLLAGYACRQPRLCLRDAVLSGVRVQCCQPGSFGKASCPYSAPAIAGDLDAGFNHLREQGAKLLVEWMCSPYSA